LEGYIGQEHLVGQGAVLRKMIDSGNISSFILWGPPGVGKTTLAGIIAKKQDRAFFTLSAVNSGVKDVREVIEKSKNQNFFSRPNPILFIDEIHRFSKSQQDSLLAAVEQGIITLIGATTENPSFEVISPLLSRCHVYILKPLESNDLQRLFDKAISEDIYLKTRIFKVEQSEAMFLHAGGDARKLLNIIDLLANSSPSEEILINDEIVNALLQQQIAVYDKGGEMHYDIASALIKSIRGSDPNAAVYWLARMVEGGEDVKFIARRLLISAAEDVGLANPNALLLANNCFQAVNVIGFPESRIILSECAIYLANSPKSNSAYMAIKNAQQLVNETGNLPVPLHLRNAPTRLMKDIGYGKDYDYSHSHIGNFAEQEYLPEKISKTKFYEPQENQHEKSFRERLIKLWKNRYDY
jgi:putative ATPase